MISVIVPVYNVEKYLEKCIQSILGQTYKNFETILVDDGSTDRSGKICDWYALKDNRLRVIHKENGGLSDARNRGVSCANGELITFIDSDDYVHERYLEILSDMNEGKNRISVVGNKKVYSNETYSPRVKKNYGIKKYNGKEAAINALYQKDLDTHAWGILVPRKIVEEFPFPINKYHEDDLTTYKYYISVDEVVVSKEILYFYRQRSNSIMHRIGQPIFDELEAADKIVIDAEKNYSFLYSAAKSKQFSNYVQVLLQINDNFYDCHLQKRILDVLDTYKIQMLRDTNARKKNRIAALLMLGDKRLLYIINKVNLKIVEIIRKARNAGNEKK